MAGVRGQMGERGAGAIGDMQGDAYRKAVPMNRVQHPLTFAMPSSGSDRACT
jgi:hypothetical protein